MALQHYFRTRDSLIQTSKDQSDKLQTVLGGYGAFVNSVLGCQRRALGAPEINYRLSGDRHRSIDAVAFLVLARLSTS